MRLAGPSLISVSPSAFMSICVSIRSLAGLEWAVKLCYTSTTHMLPRTHGQSRRTITGSEHNLSDRPASADGLYPRGPGVALDCRARKKTGEGPARQFLCSRSISDERYANSQARSLFTLPPGFDCSCWPVGFLGWGGSCGGFGGDGARGGLAGWAGRAG